MTSAPPSTEYRRVLERILGAGIEAETRQGVNALTVMQQTMTFPLAQGFPVITERSIRSFWRKPIGELCAFINGATTLKEFEEFGVDWWGPVGDPGEDAEEGHRAGQPRARVLRRRLPPLPHARTGRRSTSSSTSSSSCASCRSCAPTSSTRGSRPTRSGAAGKQPRTTIAPCHGWVHVRVLDGGLHVHMTQRSGDVPVGVPANMIQYAALALMLEQLTGYRAVAYYHTISDAHIYTDQVDAVRAMLATEPRPLPTVTLNEAGRAVTDIHDFRAEHFDLSDYHPNPAIGAIPVAT